MQDDWSPLTHSTTSDCIIFNTLYRWMRNFKSFSDCMASSFTRLKSLWLLVVGFSKEYIYRESMRTVLELKASITRHVTSIDREILLATIEHAITRFQQIIASNGMHIGQTCGWIKFYFCILFYMRQFFTWESKIV